MVLTSVCLYHTVITNQHKLEIYRCETATKQNCALRSQSAAASSPQHCLLDRLAAPHWLPKLLGRFYQIPFEDGATWCAPTDFYVEAIRRLPSSGRAWLTVIPPYPAVHNILCDRNWWVAGGRGEGTVSDSGSEYTCPWMFCTCTVLQLSVRSAKHIIPSLL